MKVAIRNIVPLMEDGEEKFQLKLGTIKVNSAQLIRILNSLKDNELEVVI